jgi:hypothetical protein
VTKRTDAKELYLAALRGDVKAQRTCTANGKPCGGRCIPRTWNCRIKGEGETPPTRGNAVQLSPEQKEKVQAMRNRRRRRSALAAAGSAAAVAAAVGGAAAFGVKNPAKARRLATKLGGGGASEALGIASAIGGPAAAGIAGVANLGVAGFQVGARAGAGFAQRRRAVSVYRGLLRKKVTLTRSLDRLERRTGYYEGFVRRAQANLSAKKSVREATNQGLKNVGKIQTGYKPGTAPRSIAQTDKTRKQNSVRSGKELREANTRLNKHTKNLNTHLAEIAKVKKSLNSTNWKVGKIKTGLESASNPIRNTFTSSLNNSRSSFRAGRRQVSGFIRYKGRRGPKADPRSWQERQGLDAADREDKKCGNSGIPDNATCTKKNTARSIAKAAAGAALVVGGAAALKNRGKIRNKFRKTGLTSYQKEQLKKMKAKGTGKYGAQARRSYTSSKMPYYTEADRTYPVKHKRLFRDAEAADAAGKKFSKTVTDPKTGRKSTVKYGAKGYSIAPGTKKGDRYCARSFGDMKSHGKDCSGKDRNTPLCLSRAKWKCSGKASRRGS